MAEKSLNLSNCDTDAILFLRSRLWPKPRRSKTEVDLGRVEPDTSELEGHRRTKGSEKAIAITRYVGIMSL